MHLYQHDFTIVIVKLLVNGHRSDSGLHSLLSRGSRCPRIGLQLDTITINDDFLICLQFFEFPKMFQNREVSTFFSTAEFCSKLYK